MIARRVLFVLGVILVSAVAVHAQTPLAVNGATPPATRFYLGSLGDLHVSYGGTRAKDPETEAALQQILKVCKARKIPVEAR